MKHTIKKVSSVLIVIKEQSGPAKGIILLEDKQVLIPLQTTM